MKAQTNSVHIVECLTHSDLGGGQTVVYGIVCGLQCLSPNNQISIVLPSHGIYGDRFRELGVDVYELPLNRLSIITLIRTFILFKRIKPTIIHSHGKGAGFYTRVIPRWCISAKRFHSYHGFHPPSLSIGAFLYRLLELLLLRTTDKVIAISKSESNDVKKTFNRSNYSYEVIENIVDCKALKKSSNDAMIPFLNNFFTDNHERFIVTMVARHDPVKNYPLALDACRMVLQQREQCAFLFVGINTNDVQYNRVKQEFQRRVCGVEVQPSVAAIISKSNAILLTSKKEAMGLVLQEAFCLSKPVIATNVAGINEVVVTNVNGLLCDENPDSIASAILRCMDNHEYYQKLCDGASQTATQYDIRELARKYHVIYTSERDPVGG
jgi:glycosyltransferase involved in cell wall biosynthesis